MTQSRRDFLKNATILASAAGVSNMNTAAIEKAFSISAKKGTTFYDAEHIVFLMQENRSFDHIFGCMKGVRGFNNPRAKILPNGNKVWIQKDKEGKAQMPFHLDMQKTKITWQGGLPHSWKDQIGAMNNGKYDQWIPYKTAMALGYYNRHDMPFYYALADAFTICDHYFCSSLTGTTPNRLFFWTGNIRPRPDGNSDAAVENSMAESRDNVYIDWDTFPELLEDYGISWKIYQNELWTTNLDDKKDYWLGNYGDNAIEYIKRYQVKLSAYFRKNGDLTQSPALSPEEVLQRYLQLSEREKKLIDHAFTTNIDQEDYLELEPFTFRDSTGKNISVDIPKEDIFYQFRKDVESNSLPTVCWLAAPQAFSDHTSSPFYGTWYVSQVLDILTQNPEIWQKTIFILNYDENDGYFDHLPPFVVPGGKIGGKVSAGIDISSDFEHKAQSAIGLGYRVPMIVASPWSRGGFVNSQVFDHTSTLMFLEEFLYKKTGNKIYSPNISSWRRAICGNLTSIFRPYNGEAFKLPKFEQKAQVITSIQNAKTKPEQLLPDQLTQTTIEKINKASTLAELTDDNVPHQEKGTRPACAIPYCLNAHVTLDKNNQQVQLQLNAADTSAGAAFNMYTTSIYDGDKGKTWAYAILPGDHLEDTFELSKFLHNLYDLHIDGPNGFSRKFRGNLNDPAISVEFRYVQQGFVKKIPVQKIELQITNNEKQPIDLILEDNAYGREKQKIIVPASGFKKIVIDLKSSSGWYDFTVHTINNAIFARSFAGHIETGQESITDPHMGGLI